MSGRLAGEKFGGTRIGLAGLGVIWRNGGIVGFLGADLGGVGARQSARGAERRGNASIVGGWRKLVRLSRAPLIEALTGSWRPSRPRPKGGAPLCAPTRGSFPVVHVRAGVGQLFPDQGHEVSRAPMGSGVRTTQRAGVNTQFWRRPKFSENMGLGRGWSRPDAVGVNNGAMICELVAGVKPATQGLAINCHTGWFASFNRAKDSCVSARAQERVSGAGIVVEVREARQSGNSRGAAPVQHVLVGRKLFGGGGSAGVASGLRCPCCRSEAGPGVLDVTACSPRERALFCLALSALKPVAGGGRHRVAL